MDSTKTQKGVVFSVRCPYIQRTVVLYRQTWEEHILPQRPELKHHVDLIKKILQEESSDTLVSQKIDNPNKIALQKKCSHFLPYNQYLRIALKVLGNKELAIVTTVIPVNSIQSSGVKKYER